MRRTRRQQICIDMPRKRLDNKYVAHDAPGGVDGRDADVFESDGPLKRFLTDIGRDISDSEGVTPIDNFTRICTFDERWLLVHLNESLTRDFELLAASSGKPHIVHCPRSHKYFGHSPFRLRLRELGFNICLGTDSLASNDDLSLFAEMRALQDRIRVIAR